jgi:hypothetical protein
VDLSMSVATWFRGRLEFRDADAIARAKQELASDGCDRHEDNAIEESDLVWAGTVLTIDRRGWMPYSCFQISSHVLATYAEHASRGDIVALNVEDGYGERIVAGGESDELDEDEVEALRREHGWE